MLRFAAALLIAGLAVGQAPKKETPAPKPPVVDPTKPAPGGFVGNTGSKIFHRADCPAAKKMKADKKVALASREEAEKKGYKACKLCLK